MRRECIVTLAAAEAEAGDFEQAVKYQQQAMSMKAATEKEWAEQQSRLELYRQRKPYRESER